MRDKNGSLDKTSNDEISKETNTHISSQKHQEISTNVQQRYKNDCLLFFKIREYESSLYLS